MFFSLHARKVTMLVRGSNISDTMSQYLVERIADTPNVEVLTNTTVVAALGNGRLEAVTVANGVSGERRDLPASAMFIFIGTAPRTELCGNLVMRDPQGFVLTGREVMTDGRPPAGWTPARDPYLFETHAVFCAGDACHGSGSAARLWARGRRPRAWFTTCNRCDRRRMRSHNPEAVGA